MWSGADRATLTLPEGDCMTDTNNVYSVSEIVGSSKESVDDAIRRAIERASKTLRNLDWFEVAEIRGHIDNEQVCHFQVTLKVGFRLEEPT
jgi:flavin-binding protein dodecin